MSKRHTDITNGEVLPEGIRFYAPLTQYDTTDHVSGVSPSIGNVESTGTTTSVASVNWDSQEGAYRIATTTGAQLAFVYNIPNVNDYTNSNYNYSVIVRIKVNSFTGTCDVISVGNTGYGRGQVGDSTASNAVVETHRFTGFTTGEWHTLAQTVGGTTLKFYIDGVNVRTATISSSTFPDAHPNMGYKWNMYYRKDHLVIGGGYYSYKYDAYVRDVMMFEKCLTQEEIIEISRGPLPQGCCFYAPMSQGDLTDHISGATMTDLNNGTITWNVTKLAYEFYPKDARRGYAMGRWNVDFDRFFNYTNDEGWTIYAKVAAPQTYRGNPFVAGLGNFDESIAFKPNLQVGAITGHVTQNIVLNNFTGCAWSFDPVSRDIQCYPATQLVWTDQHALTSLVNPANWDKSSNHIADRVCVYLARENGFRYYLYVKNIMVINRFITLSEFNDISQRF